MIAVKNDKLCFLVFEVKKGAGMSFMYPQRLKVYIYYESSSLIFLWEKFFSKKNKIDISYREMMPIKDWFIWFLVCLGEVKSSTR